jgi:glutamate--cysteine ligase
VHNREQPLRALAHELFDDMLPFAEMLDAAYEGQRYQDALAMLRQRIDHPELTPSAQVIEAIKKHGGYFDFAFAMSQSHTQALQASALTATTKARFQASVAESLAAWQRTEAAPGVAFEDFVAGYFA